MLRVRRDKLKELQQAGKDPFQITTAEVTGHSKTLIDNFDTTENETYCLAGRLMSWRDMGKASFMDLQDSEGKIQLYVRIDDVGEEVYKGLKYFDIGDIDVYKRQEPEQAPPPPEDEAQLSFLEQKDEEEEAEQRRKKRIMDFILTPDVEDGEEDFNVDDAPDEQEEPEAIEITEFESYDQVDAIKNDMAATTAKLFVRILLLLIPSAVCLYSMLAGQFTLPFGNYFTPEEPAVYALSLIHI